MPQTGAATKSKGMFIVIGAILIIGIGGALAYTFWPRSPQWSAAEITTLRSLSLESLPPTPPDPSNAFADKPEAAAFGQQLFFDKRLSANGAVACATCHQQEKSFTDGMPFSHGVGTTGRSAPSVLGASFSRFVFWDGRKDSMWAQALGPLESAVEHGGSRTQYVHLIAENYRAEYEAIFGPLPDFSDPKRFPDTAGPVKDPAVHAAWDAMTKEDQDAITRVYANMGKAIAAYERKIQPGPSRFDTYVKALLAGDTQTMQATFTPDEVAGARLFIGKAQCISCHVGPMLTDNNFYNLNVPAAKENPDDQGRAAGAKQVLTDEFNCLSKYSDAKPSDCEYLKAIKPDDKGLERAFRTPTLRNIAETAPYMHAGQFATLEDVLKHYNTGIPNRQLNLSDTELSQLVAFLRTLSGPLIAPPAPSASTK